MLHDRVELRLGRIDVDKNALDFTIYGRGLTSGNADLTPDEDLSAADKENISKGEPHLTDVELDLTDVDLDLTPGDERITDVNLRVDLGRPQDCRA